MGRKNCSCVRGLNQSYNSIFLLGLFRYNCLIFIKLLFHNGPGVSCFSNHDNKILDTAITFFLQDNTPINKIKCNNIYITKRSGKHFFVNPCQYCTKSEISTLVLHHISLIDKKVRKKAIRHMRE